MTIRQQFQQHLDLLSFFPDEVTAIIERMINDPSQKHMTGRWDENVSAYPPVLMSQLLIALERFALDWIVEHKPKHWERAYLEEKFGKRP